MHKTRIKLSLLILSVMILALFILSSCAFSKIKEGAIEGIERMINQYESIPEETTNSETTGQNNPVANESQDVILNGKTTYDVSSKSTLLNVSSKLPFKGNVSITNCRTDELSNEGKVVLINFDDEVDKYIEVISSSQIDNSKMKTYSIGEYYAECCVIKNCVIFESQFVSKSGTVYLLESTKKNVSNIVSNYRPSISGNFKIIDNKVEKASKISIGSESLSAEIKLDNADKNYKYQLVVVCDVKVVNIFKVTSKLSYSFSTGLTEEKNAEYIGSQIIQTSNSTEYWFRSSN